jgi:hypothetical protein
VTEIATALDDKERSDARRMRARKAASSVQAIVRQAIEIPRGLVTDGQVA